MALNNNLPYRRSIRLPEHDYRQPGAYFITVCTHGREHRFGEITDGRMHLNAAGRMVQSVWEELPEHFPQAVLDEFVVMPDHFHGIVVITDAVGALLAAPAGRNDPHAPAYYNNPHAPASHNNAHTPAGYNNPPAVANIPNGPGAASSAPTLGQILRRFKSESAIAVNRGTTPGQSLWQRNY